VEGFVVGLECEGWSASSFYMEDSIWNDCPLIHSDPEIVHGESVFKGTRLPAWTVVDNIDAYMDAGRSFEEAIAETLENFPTVPHGADAIRVVRASLDAHEHQLQP